MMEYKGYVGKVEFDDEAGIFHGEVLDTRDAIAFQGRSVDELKTAFQGSIDDYLAFCAQRGEEPNKPFSGQFVTRIPPGTATEQDVIAAEARDNSLCELVDACTVVDEQGTLDGGEVLPGFTLAVKDWFARAERQGAP